MFYIQLENFQDSYFPKSHDFILPLTSFYRLMKYIEYKAKLEGIKVEYVNPEYTSQRCPGCGTLNKARDRRYICKSCGYTTHRDRLGAINIMEAPVVDGVA